MTYKSQYTVKHNQPTNQPTNILVGISLQRLYHVTEAVQAAIGYPLWLVLLWYYLPTPPLGQDMTQGQFFKRSLYRFEFRVVLLLD